MHQQLLGELGLQHLGITEIQAARHLHRKAWHSTAGQLVLPDAVPEPVNVVDIEHCDLAEVQRLLGERAAYGVCQHGLHSTRV